MLLPASTFPDPPLGLLPQARFTHLLDPGFTSNFFYLTRIYLRAYPAEPMCHIRWVVANSVSLVVPGKGRPPGHSGLHSPSNRYNTTLLKDIRSIKNYELKPKKG